ncbi:MULTISPECIES: heme ABC transporter ATP-binding protein [unclassified Aureimonas]|uniref:heme ABC transporter ATP-binding protein n=1 Tax=unclassified Aureimonas TaxID=2615206 RepID=UPI0006F5F277|nr:MULTISPECIES: heme ABC transporter ATP-binding protein [unclassified Aureimonas]KQT53826.1 iron ABC transporter [Aureimonas sp. Leaf427]KQT71733.1 iron ABC transporter [Aureimonas sp. Leaf460]
MLALDRISLRRNGRTILDTVSLELRAGCFTVLVGPNGAGKSTLLKVLTGEVRPDEGEVRFEGEPLGAIRPERLATRRAVLPQASHLAFPFTVLEVVRLGLEARPGLSPDARRREPVLALERVDLGGFAARVFQDLSGGEQQRGHLARVLAQIGPPVEGGRPKAMLLDEPTASLDMRHQLDVLELARDFSVGGGLAFAIVHDLNLAAAYADRLVVIEKGRIALDGAPDEILRDGRMEEIFDVAFDRIEPALGALHLVPRRRA